MMLAPEPFFQSRGTPLSEYFRIKALTDLGHSVDLVTYHLGQNVEIKNLRIFRIPRIPFIKEIKVGPSWIKIPLDFLLFIKATVRLFKEKHDLIHSHEEAALFGLILSKIWRLPHLYDMHSSLPQQLENFQFTKSKIFKKIFQWIETFILKYSQSVIVICQDLLETAREIIPSTKLILIENFLTEEGEKITSKEVEQKKKELKINNKKIVLYTGTFEAYQGLPLLLRAIKNLSNEITLVLVGGKKHQIEELKKLVQQLNISRKVIFTGQRPSSEIPLYISLADVLVSPRISGTNTPLKIYTYLKSGKPIVATKLRTHQQVLNPQNAILVEPEPEDLAKGIHFALYNSQSLKIAQKAKTIADREYTYSKYLEKVKKSLELIS